MTDQQPPTSANKRRERGLTAVILESQIQAAAPKMLAALIAVKHGAEYPDELGDIIDEAINAATTESAP